MASADLSKRLAGLTAVVTAAGQGIGRAAAERLAAEGASVHASDLDPGLLADLDCASAEALDATDRQAVAAYFARFTRIDVLVHAVGWVHHGSIEECGPEDWRRSMTVTLDSAYHVLQAAVPRMKAAGGSIVTIASLASSEKGFTSRAAYGAAKAGVIGLTKSVAADYLTAGIRANAVCPGTIHSPSLEGRIAALGETMGGVETAREWFVSRQPMGRLGTAEEVAAMVAWLASAESGFVTGQALHIDGGMTI